MQGLGDHDKLRLLRFAINWPNHSVSSFSERLISKQSVAVDLSERLDCHNECGVTRITASYSPKASD